MLSTGSPIQNRIGNVFVPVSDMPRAVAWYSRLLGLEEGQTSHQGGIYDVPMAGETGLILDANKPITGHSAQPLCLFLTNDIAASIDWLRELGVEIAGEPQDIGSVI
ncbi:MAG TPA: VOC family protein, partial [Thermomicrobiales bacterium]|nr:VOC family protein [Thermomicrobiales bacterium]